MMRTQFRYPERRAHLLLDSVMDYALIGALIYNSNSIYALEHDDFALSCFVLLGVSGLYALICAYANRARFRTIAPVVFILVVSGIAGQFLLSLVHDDSSYLSGMWVQYTLIVPSLTACLVLRGGDYVRSILFSRLVYAATFFAVMSLLFWALSSFADMQPTRVTTLGWRPGDSRKIYSYYDVYFNIQPMTVFGMRIWRNCSIFNEPPCMSTFYGIVLGLDLFVNRAKHRVCEALIAAAMITSLSTGAALYLLLFLFPALWLLYRRLRSRKSRYCYLYVGVCGAVGILTIMAMLIVDKIGGSHSGMTHLLDFTEGTRIWLDRPVFGQGLNADEYIWTQYMSAYRSGLGYTSGLLFMLIHGGLLLAMYAIVPLVLLIRYADNWRIVYFTGFVMVNFITSVSQNYAILLLVLAYGYSVAFQSRKSIYAENDRQDRSRKDMVPCL